jgi:hypothetical protein
MNIRVPRLGLIPEVHHEVMHACIHMISNTVPLASDRLVITGTVLRNFTESIGSTDPEGIPLEPGSARPRSEAARFDASSFTSSIACTEYHQKH